VHLAHRNGRPSTACGSILHAVIRDEGIVKAGCSIDDDCLDLREHVCRGLEARSRFDLGCVGSASRSYTPGLKSLTAGCLGLRLPKPKKLATSDWGRVALSEAQIAYAARDAWAGAAISEALRDVDPDTFSPASLSRRLREQRSIGELHRKRRTRRHAKTVLSILREQFKKDGADNNHRRTSWRSYVVRELNAVVKSNRQQRGEVFHVDGLTLSPMSAAVQSNRTA